MTQGSGRSWARRALLGCLLIVIVGAIGAGTHWTELRIRYAAYKLQTVITDEDRSEWASVLVHCGEPGWQRLAKFVQTSDPATQAAAVAAFDHYLKELPNGDPQAVARIEQLLDAFVTADETGRGAILELLPDLVKRGGVASAVKCRDVVAAGLQMSSARSRIASIRAAIHPHIRLREAILPLLHATEPEVRRMALFAVGPASDDDPVISDEELFSWLHDSDADVRQVCFDALMSRGRSESEIDLGRRLTDPSAAVRLKLLLDLREDVEIADPEPWLERLSHDSEPGIRAGAARVAAEIASSRHLNITIWVNRLADADPEPSVRRIAQLYQSSPPASVDPATRQIGGP